MTKQEKIKILKKFALKHLGKPYRYGAKPYHAPRRFDCSSFTQYLYRRIGIELPRSGLCQAHCGKKIKSKDIKNLQTGDLIFFHGERGHYDKEFPQGIGHTTMYLGDGKIIHAKSKTKNGREIGRVVIEPAHKWIKRKDLIVIKRII
jgi:cell wall-associated NlpC family hydrolase